MPKRLAPLDEQPMLLPARIVLLGLLVGMASPGIARVEADSVASQAPYQTPRILILDPVVRGGNPKEARAFAGWLTTALRKDGRAVPYRPTAATRNDSSLAVSCGDSACAKEWRQKMSLEQIWFGSMEWTVDSVRVEVRALDARDSVVAKTEYAESNPGEGRAWKAEAAEAMVRNILSRPPVEKTILTQHASDRTLLSVPHARKIALKEEQVESRRSTGQVISLIGGGMLGFGVALWGTNALYCAPMGPSSDESPQERAESQRKMEACRERTSAQTLMVVGVPILIGGLVTLISSQSLAEELRDLKKQVAGSPVSMLPYVHPESGRPGVLAQVSF